MEFLTKNMQNANVSTLKNILTSSDNKSFTKILDDNSQFFKILVHSYYAYNDFIELGEKAQVNDYLSVVKRFLFTYYSVSELSHITQEIMKSLSQTFGSKAQSFSSFVKAWGDARDSDFLKSIRNLIYGLLSAGLVTIFGYSFSAEGFAKFFGLRETNQRPFTSVEDMIFNIVKFMKDFIDIGHECYAEKSIQPLLERDRAVREWTKEAHAIIELLDRLPVMEDYNSLNIIKRIDKSIMEGNVLVARGSRNILTVMRELNARRTNFVRTNNVAATREPPFSILLHGPPRTGKSFLTSLLGKYYHLAMTTPWEYKGKTIILDPDLKWDPEINLYSRTPDDEFWSGFKGALHWFINFDDLAKETNAQIARGQGTSLMELFMVVNCNGVATNQAAVEDKGVIPLLPKLVVSSTNDKSMGAYFACKTPAALLRRAPVIIENIPRKEFLDKDGQIRTDIEPNLDIWDFRVEEFYVDNLGIGKYKHIGERDLMSGAELSQYLVTKMRMHVMHNRNLKKTKNFEGELCPHSVIRPLYSCPECDALLSEATDCGDSSDSESKESIQDDDEIRCEAQSDFDISTYISPISYWCWWWIEMMAWMTSPFSFIYGRFYAFTFWLQSFSFLSSPLRNFCNRLKSGSDRWANYKLSWAYLCNEASWLYYFKKSYVGYKLKRASLAFESRLPFKARKANSMLAIFISFVFIFGVYKFIAFLTGKSNKENNDDEVQDKEKMKDEKEIQNIIDEYEKSKDFENNPEINRVWKARVQMNNKLDAILQALKGNTALAENIWNTDVVNKYFTVPDASQPNDFNQVCNSIRRSVFKLNIDLGYRTAGVQVTCIKAGIYLTTAHVFEDGLDKWRCVSDYGEDVAHASSKIGFILNRKQIKFLPNDIAIFQTSQLRPGRPIFKFLPTEYDESGRICHQIGFKDGAFFDYKVRTIGIRRGEYDSTDSKVWRGDYIKGHRPHVNPERGDCGSLLVVETSRGSFISGMHVAGQPIVGTVMYSPLKQSLFEDELEAMAGDGDMSLIEKGSASSGALGKPFHKGIHHWMQPSNCLVLGSYPGRHRPTSRVKYSKLCKSVREAFAFKCEYGRPLMTPTLNEEGKWLNPFTLAAEQQGNISPHFDETELIKCSLAYLWDIKDLIKDMDFSPVSFDEAINGIDGDPFINSLPMNTSGGFFYPGMKRKYFNLNEQDRYEPNKDILDRYREIKFQYINGKRANILFQGTLKDEPTKFKKIRTGKTRVFTACSVPFSILVRELYLRVIKFMMEYNFISECAVGMNCYSKIWEELFNYLTEFGLDKIIAGDYSTFDKKMKAMFISMGFFILDAMILLSQPNKLSAELRNFLDLKFDDIREEEYMIIYKMILKEDYLQNPIRYLIRKGIATDISHPVVNLNGDVFQFFGGNPSGQPLTVIINSIVNSLYMRYAYLTLGYDLSQFRKEVKLMTLGDDNIMGSANPGFNHTAIAEVLRKLGVPYTMADKEQESVPFIHIKDADFLKRTFRKVENQIRAPLTTDSIYKPLCVYLEKGNICEEEQLAQSYLSGLMESSLHGKDFFDNFKEKMEEILQDEKDITHFKHPRCNFEHGEWMEWFGKMNLLYHFIRYSAAQGWSVAWTRKIPFFSYILFLFPIIEEVLKLYSPLFIMILNAAEMFCIIMSTPLSRPIILLTSIARYWVHLSFVYVGYHSLFLACLLHCFWDWAFETKKGKYGKYWLFASWVIPTFILRCVNTYVANMSEEELTKLFAEGNYIDQRECPRLEEFEINHIPMMDSFQEELGVYGSSNL